MMTEDRYPVRTIFQQFYPDFLDSAAYVSPEAQKTANCIMDCKTGDLGYTVEVCEKCGYPKIHAVSCNNRNCPCCQAPLAKKWEMERNTELIEGIAYYHVVFTVPQELNPLIYSNKKLLLDLLFRASQDTVIELCADPKFMGATPGIVSVLHTWGSKLNFHPHIHMCISGGGITPSRKFVETKHRGFFLPEKVISSGFRGRFMSALKNLYQEGRLDLSMTPALTDPEKWEALVNGLFEKRWMPYVKETFNGRGNAIRYLARYSFRTAISNSRIVSYDDKNVTYSYKDYKNGGVIKQLTVPGEEFVRRYLLHILPPYFNRIRFSGYLTNCKKTFYLKLIHRLRNSIYPGDPYRKMNIEELMKALYNRDICVCARCGGRTKAVCRGRPKRSTLLFQELLADFVAE